ncbi:DUF6444 domain-containing protein [Amycolatopsis sp. lyj-109]|uniref:DUF6444 domain-containing protein n=1 Tax=Amycolatopsis sp. lyj-109 TaxID=2789287 RepID=UPI00397BECAC
MGDGVRPSYGEPAALVAAQAVELARAREEITALRAEVAALKRRLGTNSGNSSMPPSSDRFGKPAPKSLRGKSGRKQGKQPGANLSLVENPDTIFDHAPSVCSGCGTGLHRTDRAGVIRRQVVDLPPVRPPVTEHRLHRLRCRGCRHIIPVARTAQLLADLLGLPVSTGWAAGALTRSPPTSRSSPSGSKTRCGQRRWHTSTRPASESKERNWWLHTTPHRLPAASSAWR